MVYSVLVGIMLWVTGYVYHKFPYPLERLPGWPGSRFIRLPVWVNLLCGAPRRASGVRADGSGDRHAGPVCGDSGGLAGDLHEAEGHRHRDTRAKTSFAPTT